MLKNKLIKQLPDPVFKTKLINSWQNTSNIINAIADQHAKNLTEAKQIAKYFKGVDERETAKNVFNFLKSEIVYAVEPAEKQTTKTISRFLSDGQGDCKHFSLFTNTILESCGYRPLYRFAGYSGQKIQHVYSYLPKSNTITDAVLPSFDTEKTPQIKKDINMSLYALSGINDPINGLNFSKVAANIKTAAAKGSDVIKKATAEIPAAADKIKQGMVTAGLAAPRAAFLALMELNFTGMATDFKKIIAEKGNDGISWWVDFGGDRTSFTKSVETGANKKAILSGVDEERAAYDEIYKGYSGDGVQVGVVVATTAATAAPILIKAADIVKKLKAAGVDPAKLATQAKQAANTFQDLTGKKVTDVIFKKEAGKTTKQTEIKPSDLSAVDTETAKKVATAAVAQGAGVSSKTIDDIAASNGSGTDKLTLLQRFAALPQPKKLAVAGGGALIIGLIIYSITKK
jgi:hypothetical protein